MFGIRRRHAGSAIGTGENMAAQAQAWQVGDKCECYFGQGLDPKGNWRPGEVVATGLGAKGDTVAVKYLSGEYFALLTYRHDHEFLRRPIKTRRLMVYVGDDIYSMPVRHWHLKDPASQMIMGSALGYIQADFVDGIPTNLSFHKKGE